MVQAVRAASRADGAVLAKLSELLAGVVNEEFKVHCRAAAVRSGRLIVSVDAPSMVSVFAARWRQRLVAALREHRRSGVRDVSFEFGHSGIPFECVGVGRVTTNG